MAPSLDDFESQWLAQLRSMREAIADLKLDQRNSNVQPYGHDIVVDDDLTGGSGSDDIWDIWSNEEETELSSDVADSVVEDIAGLRFDEEPFDRRWLRERCITLARGNSGLDAEQLEEQLSVLLASDMPGMA